jgi:hypothetical protein
MLLLLELGADPLLANVDNTTPLMVAAGVGLFSPGENPGTPEESFEAVKICLEMGGDPFTIDRNGDTVIHGTAWWGSVETLDLLAKLGVPLNHKNSREWSPLRIAAGVHMNGSFKNQPEIEARLRQMLSAQGVSTDDVPHGEAGAAASQSGVPRQR